jgi:integrase
MERQSRNQFFVTLYRRGRHSFELKFDAGTDPITRKRVTRYASFKGTRRDAEIELARLVAAFSKGEYVDPSKITVAEFLDRWERDWASVNVSPKTLERYSEILRKHIRAHVGAVQLQKLRPAHLAELYAKLAREGRAPGVGLAPRTVLHVHRVFHRALGHAVQWNLLQQNPTDAVDAPRVEGREITILRAADIKLVLNALRGRALYVIAITTLGTGMRRSELCALRWQDVELDRALLRVEQTLEATKARLRIKAPKTKYGRRSITLPASLVTELRAHRKAQQEQRLALGLGKAPADALVFATWEGHTRHPDGLTKEWSNAMDAMKRPEITLHSLRHTHASQLIASGLDVLTISRRLGHGSPAITLAVYGHLFTNTDDRAAQVIEAALSGRQ